jgi:hypothetical protein
LKTEKPDAPKSAQIIHFPLNRIVRTILKGNRVYNPGKLYPEWGVGSKTAAVFDDPKGAA